MTDRYLLVRVPEHSVGVVRNSLHNTAGYLGGDMVFFANGEQARFYGSDIKTAKAVRDYMFLDSIYHEYLESAMNAKEQRERNAER